MPKIRYQEMSFGPVKLAMIHTIDAIVQEEDYDGLKLTLRQVYYVLVSRDLFPDDRKYTRIPGTNKWRLDLENGTKNAEPNYKWLGDLVVDGRRAGLLDWSIIEDRTRNLMSVSHWDTPADIMNSAASSFRIDKWEDQDCRCEIWIEKEALAGVFKPICDALDVPMFACKGYTSESEMWSGAMRYVRHIEDGKDVNIFHFGDHDPSGVDMTRDIQDRLRMFVAHHVGEDEAERLTITRVALNIDQVRRYNPPPNPAKITDSRCGVYIEKFGESSWELDALNPRVMANLVRASIESVRDGDRWDAQVERENRDRATLSVISDHWPDVEKHSAKRWGKEIKAKSEEEPQE